MVSITETKLMTKVCEERLVVLIPEQLENVAEFARQVYWLAQGQQRGVVYTTLNGGEADALANTRLLATLEALTQSETMLVQSMQVKADRWSDALRMVVQPGDIVICPDAQTLMTATLLPSGNGDTAQAGSALEQELGIRIQFLPEVYVPEKGLPAWVRSIFSWVTGLAILVGFTLLEFRLAGVINGGLKKAVLVLLVALEFGILYAWDKVFA